MRGDEGTKGEEMSEQRTCELCRDCEHWCAEMQDITEMAECLLAASNNHKLACPESKVMAEHTGGIAAHLWTAPDFGCVQWEARQP